MEPNGQPLPRDEGPPTPGSATKGPPVRAWPWEEGDSPPSPAHAGPEERLRTPACTPGKEGWGGVTNSAVGCVIEAAFVAKHGPGRPGAGPRLGLLGGIRGQEILRGVRGVFLL